MRDAAVKKSVVIEEQTEAGPLAFAVEKPMGNIVYQGER